MRLECLTDTSEAPIGASGECSFWRLLQQHHFLSCAIVALLENAKVYAAGKMGHIDGDFVRSGILILVVDNCRYDLTKKIVDLEAGHAGFVQ